MSFKTVRSPVIDQKTGDKILPLRFWDSNDVFPKLTMDFTFRFDDVLDPEKLRWSLERVLELGDWNQIGARYRKNAKGKLEVHIPQHFDEKRPGIAWSHDDRQQSISENETAKRLPKHNKDLRPTLYEDGSAFESLTMRPGRPTKLVHWTETDHPALSVHVTSFTDATLITMSWNHMFFDALGRQSLLQAWQAVLDGKEEDVPTCIPYEHDPIVGLAEGVSPQQHHLHKLALTGIMYIFFVIGYIYELIVYPKESGRLIRFPGPWVEELRECAIAERVAQGVPAEEAFLSHGDVLLSYWCKTSLSAQHMRPSQPIHIINAMNLRGLEDEVPLPGKTAYISNAVSSSDTLVTIADIDKWTVSELAGRIRADLKKCRASEQVRAIIATQLENYTKGRRAAPSGPWNQILFAWSNWSRARFFEVDFSSAVTKTGFSAKDRASKPGRPSLIMLNGHADGGLTFRNGGPLMGRDANGDWWVNWVMRAEAWREVEEAFSRA